MFHKVTIFLISWQSFLHPATASDGCNSFGIVILCVSVCLALTAKLEFWQISDIAYWLRKNIGYRLGLIDIKLGYLISANIGYRLNLADMPSLMTASKPIDIMGKGQQIILSGHDINLVNN